MTEYTVREVAGVGGVMVRALHHHDDGATGLAGYVRDAIWANLRRSPGQD